MHMDAAPDSSGSGKKWVGWLALVLLGLAGARTARAHDLWLEPELLPSAAGKGEETVLHLRLGDQFKTGEERPLQKDHVARFDLFSDRAKRRDLLAAGQEGQQPAAKLRPDTGELLAVMDRTPRPITMEHDKFNRYLEEEGQEAIIALRARLGQTEQSGKEVYTRYLKALVEEHDPMGSMPSTLYKRRVGQRLEILLENDPGRLKPDKMLTVKVWFEGKPLAGAKVFAYRREASEQGADHTLTATTSALGLADFKLDQTGVWLVRLVHFRVPVERRPESTAAWESCWAAYSFAVRETPPAAVPVVTPKE